MVSIKRQAYSVCFLKKLMRLILLNLLDENDLIGCSDFLVNAFGPKVGKHARAAAGFVSLPLSAPVEIEMIVEID